MLSAALNHHLEALSEISKKQKHEEEGDDEEEDEDENGLNQSDEEQESGSEEEQQEEETRSKKKSKNLNQDSKDEQTKKVEKFRNQQRVLVLSSRGTASRHRHLLKDLKSLLPHHKKDAKLDSKEPVRIVNEIAELKNCNTAIYLEVRRKTDCYMWISRTPNGPSARFFVENGDIQDSLFAQGLFILFHLTKKKKQQCILSEN